MLDMNLPGYRYLTAVTLIIPQSVKVVRLVKFIEFLSFEVKILMQNICRRITIVEKIEDVKIVLSYTFQWFMPKI